ncbi:hypothetical protein [Solemya velum gill symbiont]|uniref:hypothetical protein n=1 Tax=Solemya velum gill symbiont TaxID=2340 RepID=UPI0015C3B79E|nr:hypothetical protein [Solemya velum gill symbiont]
MTQTDLDSRLLHHLGVLYGEQAQELLPRLHQVISHHIELAPGGVPQTRQVG